MRSAKYYYFISYLYIIIIVLITVKLSTYLNGYAVYYIFSINYYVVKFFLTVCDYFFPQMIINVQKLSSEQLLFFFNPVGTNHTLLKV